MKKKLLLLISVGILLGAAVYLIGLFSPRPIVSHPDTDKIFWIEYNPDFGNPESEPVDMNVQDFSGQDILEYLSRCQERRTGKRGKSYSLHKVALSFGIITEKGVKHIYLGDINESGMGYGTVLYEILNPQETLEGLLELMDLS